MSPELRWGAAGTLPKRAQAVSTLERMIDPAPGPPLPRRGIPLKDRPVYGATPARAEATRDRHRRHCWVQHPTGVIEGLVLQWAQDRGWVALVVYVVTAPGGGEQIVQEWLPAGRLQPVETPAEDARA